MDSAAEEKSDDKKDIETEEREKIMNAENTAQDKADEIKTNEDDVAKLSATDIKQGREVKPKKIPIGGIQMPGFFTRSKSKEKCKDGDSEQVALDQEGIELIDSSKEKEQTETEEKQQWIKLPNPFCNKRNKPGENLNIKSEKPNEQQQQQRKSLIDTIRMPLVSVFPRKSKPNLDPQNLGTTSGAAELASMETLDDNDKSADKTDDEMKNVKLDTDDKADIEKQEIIEDTTWRSKLYAYRVVISAILVFLLILIVVIAFVIPGGQVFVMPIRDGKYISAVTLCGLVEGMLEDGAFAFRGIPYALAPVDDRRWQSATPLNNITYCWNGTLTAHNATAVCSQLYANGSIDGTEDCLTLDIVTPYVRYDNPLPVVVMIGGESLTGGSPGKMRPSSRYARSRDVLFVRPNFRMGVLGFLSLGMISSSSYPQTSGNYGLSDIIEALRWVKLNIQNFGGDPTSVTLFGHRAGATLVTALASSNYAKGLFARAWATSGSAIYPGQALAESETLNNEYINSFTCKDLFCLRTQTVEKLIEAVPDTWRKPSPDLPQVKEIEASKRHNWLVLDGHYLKQHPAEVWKTEEGLPVKLVLGTTAHSAASDKLLLRHSTWTPELIHQHIQESLLGSLNLTDDILMKYNATYQGLVALVSDIRTVCPLLAISSQHQREVPFYVVTQTRGPHMLSDIDSDVDAILGRYEPRSPEQRRYVAAMQQFFYHYVWHGEVLQMDQKGNQVFIIGQDVLPDTKYAYCDFWINRNIVPKYAQLD